MTWNYRIIKHDTDKSGHFAVHEVYYDGKGNVEAWTEDPIELIGESKRDIIKDIGYVTAEIKQPILNESELLKNLQSKKRNESNKKAS